MRLLAALLGLSLAMTACATSKGNVAADPVPGHGTSTSTPGGSNTPATGNGTTAPRSGAAGQTPGATATTTPSLIVAGPGKRNTIPLSVTLNRACAEHGDELVSEAVTVAGAQITFAAGYVSSNDLPPDFEYVPKEANVTGTHTWRWVLRPDIRPGDAMLSVVASKEGKGASYNIPFRVATSC